MKKITVNRVYAIFTYIHIVFYVRAHNLLTLDCQLEIRCVNSYKYRPFTTWAQ